MSNVLINKLTSVHAGSNGTLTTSDVCKTPGKCVPVAYTNIAKSSDAAKTASTVKINGHPACNLGSIFSQSSGDEAGSCGGVSSGTTKGIAEFVSYSPDVLIEGLPAVRQNDLMTSNNKNTPPMPLQQPGAKQPTTISDEGAIELETKKITDKIDWDVVGTSMINMKSQIGAVDSTKIE
ncbi:MAG: DUF4150 domain-containing protein [Thiohalomonadales bacterium]